MQNFRIIGGCLLACAAWFVSSLVGAQVPDNGQHAPGATDLKPNAEQPFSLPPIPTDGGNAAPDRSARLKIMRVAFRGNTVLTAELTALASPYVGQVASLDELETLRHQLTQLYVDHGYVNSGVLLPQQIVNGELIFEAVEGRLTAIRTNGMARLDANYLSARLWPEPDELLNMEVLRERFQLLLNDPLFARLNARMAPGDKPAEAVLEVDVERAKAYQLNVAVNNYRPVSIGSNSVVVSGWLRNLTGTGDVLEATLQTPFALAQGRHHSLAWTMPLGYQGTQLSIALDHGNSSVIEEPTKVLDIHSISSSRELGLSHTVFETLSEKLAFGVNRVSRESVTTLLGDPFPFTLGAPDGATHENLWRYWQFYSSRSEKQVFALRSTFSSGRNNLEYINDLPLVTQVPRQFHVWVMQGQFGRQVLANGGQLILRGTMQYTRQHLLSLDAFAVGGANTIRGYRENQLLRDRGAYVNLEFEYPVVRNPDGLAASVTPFYDHGQLQNVGEASVSLASCGVAARMQWRGITLDWAWAKRLRYPAAVKAGGATLQDKGMHVQLSYQY